MHHCSPDSAAENHISLPDGAHAKPSRDSHPLEIVRNCPARSTITRSPRSSTFGGCRNRATCCPSGETRMSLIQPSPSSSTFPMGYCKRHLSLPRSMTASSFPSGDQSASTTCSSNSRGAVPVASGLFSRAPAPSPLSPLLSLLPSLVLLPPLLPRLPSPSLPSVFLFS